MIIEPERRIIKLLQGSSCGRAGPSLGNFTHRRNAEKIKQRHERQNPRQSAGSTRSLVRLLAHKTIISHTHQSSKPRCFELEASLKRIPNGPGRIDVAFSVLSAHFEGYGTNPIISGAAPTGCGY